MRRRSYSSLYEIYTLAIRLCGEQASTYKRSMLFFSIAYISKGVAFGMFYPLLKSMFAEPVVMYDIKVLLFTMLALSIISLVAKWKANDFDFCGEVIDVAHLLRTDLGKKLRMMPLETLANYKTGNLNSIFSSNVDESLMLIGTVSSLVLRLVLLPLTIITVTFFVDIRLATLMLVLFPLTIPLYYRIRKSSFIEKTELSHANAELEAGFIEYIQGLPVLRAVNKTGENAENLQDAISNVRSIQKKGQYKTQIPFILIGTLVETTLMILLFLGFYFVLNDTLALVTLGASIVIVARLTEPLTLFVNVIKSFDMLDSAFTRIKSVLDISPLPVASPIEQPEYFDITFDQVEFQYSGQQEKTINNVSFQLPSQTMTAIVGDSGSGKTTLTKLLTRYADIQHGKITIGDVNIKNMHPDELMKHISVVFQDVYLFDDTILNNIKMAKPNATDEEVEAAAQSAYCHQFITRLPKNYDTEVGDIGGNLSGGEKQRISIARAILKDAPIVILDEPTAALDTESEVAVQHAIDKLVEDKTIIVIAHRLSTIVGADKIIVMDKGKIIEDGTHEELLVKKGKYFKMWSAQQRVKEWHIADSVTEPMQHEPENCMELTEI